MVERALNSSPDVVPFHEVHVSSASKSIGCIWIFRCHRPSGNSYLPGFTFFSLQKLGHKKGFSVTKKLSPSLNSVSTRPSNGFAIPGLLFWSPILSLESLCTKFILLTNWCLAILDGSGWPACFQTISIREWSRVSTIDRAFTLLSSVENDLSAM